jgi:methylmalonyl-CoA/ethylmalonyl-CoA epimerase
MTASASGLSLPAGLQERQLDHLAIAVTSLEAGSAPFLLLGARQQGDDEHVPGQQVLLRLLRFGDTLLELISSTTPDGPVARFIERRGPGLHHVALSSSNLALDMEQLASRGLEFLSAAPLPGRGGSLVAFIHPRSTGGVLVELVEPRQRPGG